MRIELYGIARARAGREKVEVEAFDLEQAIRGLAAACPGLVPDVIVQGRLREDFLVSLNGDHFVDDVTTALAEDDTLIILGAQAGG